MRRSETGERTGAAGTGVGETFVGPAAMNRVTERKVPAESALGYRRRQTNNGGHGVNKLALFVGGAGAAVAMAVVGAGQALADAPDVTGEPYAKAVSILKSQGYSAVFGGAVGSDLPQSQCIVIEQSLKGSSTWNTPWGQSGTMRLRLDCTLHPGQTKPQAPNTHSVVPPGGSAPGATGTPGSPGATGSPGSPGGSRPTPGAGTVTVTPVPIG